MKHIRIEVKDLGEGWGKVLRIVQQTHRGEKFGKEGTPFFKTEDFCLYSAVLPAVGEGMFYVQGGLRNMDNIAIGVFSEKWLTKLKKIVRTYNEYFADDTVVPKSLDVEIIK